MRSSADAIGGLSLVVGVIALLIFIGVEAALLYSAWKYRASRVAGPARQIHGNTRLEVAWTAIPIVILVAVFALTVGTMREIGASALTGGPPTMRVIASGYQWWWEFRYPTASGEVVAANEMHIPAGTVIDLELQAGDVIHSFWVPELAGKTDMIPGKTNHLRLYAPRTGVFQGQCAEFCGVEHAWMRLTVVAEPAADFQRWLDGQGAARTGAGGDGERVFLSNVCVSCHTIRGTAAKGVAGPDLTHVGGRATLGAGVLKNDPVAMRAWLLDPQRHKPGSFMPHVPLTDAELDALVTYLEALR